MGVGCAQLLHGEGGSALGRAPGGARGGREPAAQDAERQVPVKLRRAWAPGWVGDSRWVPASGASGLQRKSKDVTVDPLPPGHIKVRIRSLAGWN